MSTFELYQKDNINKFSFHFMLKQLTSEILQKTSSKIPVIADFFFFFSNLEVMFLNNLILLIITQLFLVVKMRFKFL